MKGTGQEPAIEVDGKLSHCNQRMKWEGTSHTWEGQPGQGQAHSVMRYSCTECSQQATLTLTWDC